MSGNYEFYHVFDVSIFILMLGRSGFFKMAKIKIANSTFNNYVSAESFCTQKKYVGKCSVYTQQHWNMQTSSLSIPPSFRFINWID